MRGTSIKKMFVFVLAAAAAIVIAMAAAAAAPAPAAMVNHGHRQMSISIIHLPRTRRNRLDIHQLTQDTVGDHASSSGLHLLFLKPSKHPRRAKPAVLESFEAPGEVERTAKADCFLAKNWTRDKPKAAHLMMHQSCPATRFRRDSHPSIHLPNSVNSSLKMGSPGRSSRAASANHSDAPTGPLSVQSVDHQRTGAGCA